MLEIASFICVCHILPNSTPKPFQTHAKPRLLQEAPCNFKQKIHAVSCLDKNILDTPVVKSWIASTPYFFLKPRNWSRHNRWSRNHPWTIRSHRDLMLPGPCDHGWWYTKLAWSYRNLHLKSSKRRRLPASIFKDGKNGGMMENWGYAAAAWAANLIQKTPGFWHRDLWQIFPTAFKPCTWPCVGCMLLWQHMQLLQLLLCTLIEAWNGGSFPTWIRWMAFVDFLLSRG